MRIIWSPLAVKTAAEIAEYISRDNPIAAEEWVDTVFSKVEQLKLFPEKGRMVPEINSKDFRELIYENYRIISRVEKTQIFIHAICYGKQILPIDEIQVKK